MNPYNKKTATISEDQLLDVGIGIFKPGVDETNPPEGVYPNVRKAEGRYMAFKLMETLQSSGNWGAVRVIPERQSEMDVWVDAEIVHSDGEKLTLKANVEDTTGKRWFNKTYKETASVLAYDTALRNRSEAFQGVYNQIANDMLEYRRKLTAENIKTIRTVSELKFAERFFAGRYR